VSRKRQAGKPVFISYRREDSAGFTRAIANHLREVFGEDRVFVDVDTLAPGDDFTAKIRQTVGECAAELVIIGPNWLTAEQDGGRRLEDPGDYVRLEIGAALARDVRVIPILVDGASMPAAADLPEDLAALATRNALSVEHGDFDHDMARLTEVLGVELGATARPGRAPHGFAWKRAVPLVLGLVAVAAMAGVLAWTQPWKGAPDPLEETGSLPAPVATHPTCGETVSWPPRNYFFGVGWEPVDGASTYTVEFDCFGCEQFGRQWHSQGGVPWLVRPGVGLRTPIYTSTVHEDLRRQGGLALRWRVWAIDDDGVAGAKSDWCKVTFGGQG